MVSLSGCALTPTIRTPIHESDRGIVALRTFSDPNFQASHPKDFEPSIISRVLKGLYVREQREPLARFLTDDESPIPAFSTNQITFLSPHLNSALSQATAEEQITFLLTETMSNQLARTEGILFIQGPILHLALTHYRVPSSSPTLLSKPTTSFNRPKEWRLAFYPITALTNPTEEVPIHPDYSAENALHIQYDRLSQFPVTTSDRKVDAVPLDSALPEGSVTDTKIQKELESLQQELDNLKKSLKGQDRKIEDLENHLNLENP